MHLRVWYKIDDSKKLFTTNIAEHNGIVVGSDMWDGSKFIVRRDDGTFDRVSVQFEVFKSEWVDKP